MSSVPGQLAPAPQFRSSPWHWAVLALAGTVLLASFHDALEFMVRNWIAVEEYGYGWFVPPICAFLIWQKSDRLRAMPLHGQWSGLALLALALAMRQLGELSAIRVFGQYGFVVGVYGLSVCAIGWRGTRVIALPLAVLAFMIPLPQFLLRELSQQLQLLSSQLGVALIRLADISVFLEGNVIDLGSFQLQVVEACSGLRYLFPLLVLGFLAAYLFKGALWKRVLIVVSTVPLTIVINSLRIGLIGITVEYWGPAMAEGLLHDFEGWFMFMVCIALLVGEMAVLARLGTGGTTLGQAFAVELPAPARPGGTLRGRGTPLPLLLAIALLGTIGVHALTTPERTLTRPARQPFDDFPSRLEGGWQGRFEKLDEQVLATLALDDYINVNYARPGEPMVNFYSAYYASQSGGESSHSPRTCIPGGGWAITQLQGFDVDWGHAVKPRVAAPLLRVNRALIEKGESRQLVYYWFRQRGRELSDEFQVKWYILQDGILRNRSDGALLRLVTPLRPQEDVADADRRLAEFIAQLQPRLSAYVPD